MVLFIITEAMISYGLSALGNINENELKKDVKKQDKKAERILYLVAEMERYESVILSILTAMNMGIGMLCTLQLSFFSGIVTKVFIAFLLIYSIILFGNVLPGRLALKHSKQSARQMVGFMEYCLKFWKPIVVGIEFSIKVIFFLFRLNPKEYIINVTEEEIISIVNEGLEQGVLEDSEVEMISNIIEFDEKEVKDIMTRRQNMISIDGNMMVMEALKVMLEKRYSRFPMYKDDVDNITGVLFLKDVAKHYIMTQEGEIPVSELAKKPYLVPDTQKIDILFKEMQLKKIHMAVAVDEYGQTVGIVAMEDILEEIVGNIFDELPEEETFIVQQRENTFLMKGLSRLEEVSKKLQVDLEEESEKYETINGLLISLLGHIPKEKERAVVTYKGYQFHILDVKNKRIRYVRAIRIKV